MTTDEMIGKKVIVEEIRDNTVITSKGVYRASENHLLAVMVTEVRSNGRAIPGVRKYLKWFNSMASTFVGVVLID